MTMVMIIVIVVSFNPKGTMGWGYPNGMGIAYWVLSSRASYRDDDKYRNGGPPNKFLSLFSLNVLIWSCVLVQRRRTALSELSCSKRTTNERRRSTSRTVEIDLPRRRLFRLPMSKMTRISRLIPAWCVVSDDDLFLRIRILASDAPQKVAKQIM